MLEFIWYSFLWYLPLIEGGLEPIPRTVRISSSHDRCSERGGVRDFRHKIVNEIVAVYLSLLLASELINRGNAEVRGHALALTSTLPRTPSTCFARRLIWMRNRNDQSDGPFGSSLKCLPFLGELIATFKRFEDDLTIGWVNPRVRFSIWL